MKLTKLLGLIAIAILAAVLTVFMQNRLYPSPDVSAALNAEYAESCLLPNAEQRSVWECYELTATGEAYQPVTIRHTDGTEHRVLTFQDNGQTKFRFTPTKPGVWSFSTGGEIEITAERPNYAQGFVAANGQKWVRTATGEAFVPQFVMYDKPDLEAGLDEFIDGHGFTGFHITNLRDFMENPAYFEAVVLKTYRRGGVTHFWIWGDRDRKETPTTYGVDAEQLYKEIAARLAPIPGWTFSYGFDLFEWADAAELEALQATFQSYSSYSHPFGGRGHKNEYREISPNLDYASWEWHQPDYDEYLTHLEKANNRPAFSEDRFRIRTPSRYPEKDYNPELTLQGLWNSMLAGGVANIWGHQPRNAEFSEPYPNKDWIKTYSTFTENYFTVGMQPDDQITTDGHCLRDGQTAAICYLENTDQINLRLDSLQVAYRAVAVDTQAAYAEIELTGDGYDGITWTAPRRSTWAIGIAPLDPLPNPVAD